jgi:PTH1 family peptidyl-tRNA hydrolase
MNQSGMVLTQVLEAMTQEFLIVVDDINLPLGKLRIRKKGSDGGHLGLRSIIHELESSDFPRMRIGVGRSNEDAASYVLSAFTSREKKVVHGVIEKGIKGIKILVTQGFEPAQNFINSIDLMVKFEARNPKS